MSDLLTYYSNIPKLIEEVLTVVKDGKTVVDIYPDLAEQVTSGINIRQTREILRGQYG